MPLEHACDEIKRLISFLHVGLDTKNLNETKEAFREKCLSLSNQLNQIDSSGSNYETASLSNRRLVSDLRDILDREETIKEALEKAATIYDLVRQAQRDMESLSKRQIMSTETYLRIELHSIEDLLSAVKEKIESSLFAIEELCQELGVDITKDDWYLALLSAKPEDLQIYLYIQKLLMECVNVSAVSKRDLIISENFL